MAEKTATKSDVVTVRTPAAAKEVFEELAASHVWSLSQWCDIRLREAARRELKQLGKSTRRLDALE